MLLSRTTLPRPGFSPFIFHTGNEAVGRRGSVSIANPSSYRALAHDPRFDGDGGAAPGGELVLSPRRCSQRSVCETAGLISFAPTSRWPAESKRSGVRLTQRDRLAGPIPKANLDRRLSSSRRWEKGGRKTLDGVIWRVVGETPLSLFRAPRRSFEARASWVAG